MKGMIELFKRELKLDFKYAEVHPPEILTWDVATLYLDNLTRPHIPDLASASSKSNSMLHGDGGAASRTRITCMRTV